MLKVIRQIINYIYFDKLYEGLKNKLIEKNYFGPFFLALSYVQWNLKLFLFIFSFHSLFLIKLFFIYFIFYF